MSGLANWFTQVASISRFSLQTIPKRLGSSLSAAFGIAGVVAVMVGVLSISQGILYMVKQSSVPENALVLRSGANSELVSGLQGEEAEVILEAPGVGDWNGQPAVSPELFLIINLPKRNTGTDANVPLRGVAPAAFGVRDRFALVEGRAFEWGLNEVIVGRGAAEEFSGLRVGESIDVAGQQWPVVGIFEAGGGIAESEVWADAALLQSAYRRGNTYQAVYTKLQTAGNFREFKDALTTDPRLNVKVVREAEFYSSQSQMLTGLITGIGGVIAILMGLGAVFGALNTMYNAVSSRTREIATLRALGFNRGPVVLSVLFESLVLALGGGLVGGALAYLAFDGFRAATINFSSFSQIAFAFDVTPALLIQGVLYAALLGLFGGLFPAVRAARLPISAALREQ